MKTQEVIFEFEKKTYPLQIPIYLIHINNLSNELALLDEEHSEIEIGNDSNDNFNQACDYVELKCCKIFAKHLKLNYLDLFCNFINPHENDVSPLRVEIIKFQ